MQKFQDYNKELRDLYRKSGLSKSKFAKAIGIEIQNLTTRLENKNQLRRTTFEKYKAKFYKKSIN